MKTSLEFKIKNFKVNNKAVISYSIAALILVLGLADCTQSNMPENEDDFEFGYEITPAERSVEHYHEDPGEINDINDVTIEYTATGGDGTDFLRVTYNGDQTDLFQGESMPVDIQPRGDHEFTIESYIGGTCQDTNTETIEGRDTAPYMPTLGDGFEEYFNSQGSQYLSMEWNANIPYTFPFEQITDLNNDPTEIIAEGLPSGVSISNDGITINMSSSQVRLEPYWFRLKNVDENGVESEYRDVFLRLYD